MWLDENTYVLRSQIVNRISQYMVAAYQEGLPEGVDFRVRRYATIAEQAPNWNPPVVCGIRMDHVVGREVLVERAIGFFEGAYNLDYRTMAAEQWVVYMLQYVVNLEGTSPEVIDIVRGAWYESYGIIQDQQLVMEAVFVTDESLVYLLPEHESMLEPVNINTCHNM